MCKNLEMVHRLEDCILELHGFRAVGNLALTLCLGHQRGVRVCFDLGGISDLVDSFPSRRRY